MAKKLFRYLPPHTMPAKRTGETKDMTEAIRKERLRGHRVKIMSGLTLIGGEAMLIDEELVAGIAHIIEVNPDGTDPQDKYSRPDPDMEISIPDNEAKLEEAVVAIKERKAKAGSKKVGKRTMKAAEKKAVAEELKKAKAKTKAKN